MKFSEKWLREWVDPPISTEGLVEQLTMAGLEVDSVEPAGAALAGVVVAEVLSVEAHPDADKLLVCQVSAGQDHPVQVVCGAPNVIAGGKYPLAQVGARLPGDFRIKKSELRGVESRGMLCSARELGLGDSHEGLMTLPSEFETGAVLSEVLDLDDTMIEIDLTPNRGDCLGVEGVAREVGTLTRTPVSPVVIEEVAATVDDTFPVEVLAAEACPRYLGRVIRGVKTDAISPLWMQERLRRSGLRSIDPVVDVTNYVLLELGQPMHAFDLDRLNGGIVVRYALKGEQLTLLDERKVELAPETLVIADQDKPLAIAGVMGGIDSGVQAGTTDLFLECACFAPQVIAGKARHYAMHTDSAHRFERGVDPFLQHRAMQRATRLLLDIVGGEAGPVTEVAAPEYLPQRDPITLRKARIERVLGVLPAADEVTDILARLGMDVSAIDAGWMVVAPTWRFDISIEADLVEEIGRVYGYNRLPLQTLAGSLEMLPVPETDVRADRIADLLVARGYQEAVTYSFVDPGFQAAINPDMTPVPLANPISSEMSVMRTSLWPGLLKVVSYNLNRQRNRLRLFEYGLRFFSEAGAIRQDVVIGAVLSGSRTPEYWNDADDAAVDFYDIKGDVEAILELTGRADHFHFVSSTHPALHPGQSAVIRSQDGDIGWIGRIHPALVKQHDLDAATYVFQLEFAALHAGRLAQFSSISRYPSIRRDLAVVIDAEVPVEALQGVVHDAAGELLQELLIFDVYQGEGVETGRKSIAFGLILQDSSRTLTDEDIEALVTRVTGRLADTIGATLRE
ncbi:MAG: phenylalanine--tRNA ligase subunit beta [Pseudomonadota bacterium]